MVAKRLHHNWKMECFLGGCKSSSKMFILFDLVWGLRFYLLVSRCWLLDKKIRCAFILCLSENTIIYMRFQHGKVHHRLPKSLLDLRAVSSPEVLHMLPTLWYHWCSAVTQNWVITRDCQSYQRVPLCMSIQLFSATHKRRLEFTGRSQPLPAGLKRSMS